MDAIFVLSFLVSNISIFASDDTIWRDIFYCSLSFMLFIGWLRLASVFLRHPTLGPLILSVQEMRKDIYHIVVLGFWLVVGGAFAFYRLTFPVVLPGFDSEWIAMFSLVMATMILAYSKKTPNFGPFADYLEFFWRVALPWQVFWCCVTL